MLVINNLLPLDYSCTIVSDSKLSVFHLAHSSLLLNAKEKKYLSIKFTPIDPGKFKEKLGFISFGGDIQWVTVTGSCDRILKLHSSKVDFGPVDIFYPGAKRKFLLSNMHPNKPLRVQYSATTSGITVNNNEPLLLQPSETRNIEVEFASEYAGYRYEQLKLFGCGSEVVELDLVAFSGQTITCPVIDEIFIAPAPTEGDSNVHIPIRNTSSQTVHLLVSLPSRSNFKMSLLELGASNSRRNNNVTSHHTLDSKPYNADGMIGLHLVGTMNNLRPFRQN